MESSFGIGTTMPMIGKSAVLVFFFGGSCGEGEGEAGTEDAGVVVAGTP